MVKTLKNLLQNQESFKDESWYKAPWPFVHIFDHPSTEGSVWNLKKIGPGVSKKSHSKVWTDGWRMVSDHNSLSRVTDTGELKKKNENVVGCSCH